MTLSRQLTEYISACFTALWVQSHEHDDALTEIAQMCHSEQWRLAVWDIQRGLVIRSQDSSEVDTGTNDPLAAIRALDTLASTDGASLLVLVNFHRFLNSTEVLQTLAAQISKGKQDRTFILILSPIVQIPVELEKLFVVLSHDLPGREQLQEIAHGIATEDGELPEGSELDLLLDAAAGLTRYEAEGAFSLSLVRHGRIQPDAVWDLKCQTLKKSGLMQLYRGTEDFSSLGGLASLKAFTRRALLHAGRGNPLKRPRGVLLLSPPGCGKSHNLAQR